MINLNLVTTDKPKQISMTWCLMMFESEEFDTFLKKRTKLMQQFFEIRSIEKKSVDELNTLYQIFYEPVS